MMKKTVVWLLAIGVLLALTPAAQAATVRLGPFVGARGGGTAGGIALDMALKDKLWFDLRASYMSYHGDDITAILPGLSYRDSINDKLEWFAGAGLAIIPVRVSNDEPGGSNSDSGTAVGAGVNVGVSYRLTDRMLTSGWIEYAYGEGDGFRVNFTGLCLGLDFELGK